MIDEVLRILEIEKEDIKDTFLFEITQIHYMWRDDNGKKFGAGGIIIYRIRI